MTLNIADHKLSTFLAFIKDLDYIEVLTSEVDSTKPSEKSSSPAETDDFLALAGIWEDREISLEEIRSKAWPGRK